MISETYKAGSTAEMTNNKISKTIARINKQLDVALPVTALVPRERSLVGPNQELRITFKASKSFKELHTAQESILDLFKAGNLNAMFELSYHTTRGEINSIATLPFPFRSSLLP